MAGGGDRIAKLGPTTIKRRPPKASFKEIVTTTRTQAKN